MPGSIAIGSRSEQRFVELVDTLVADPDRADELTDLLREDHAVYNQRSAAAVVRMRGWAILALERVGLPESALIYVLEELDTGMDAYLVAAAARALRSYPNPAAEFAPFIVRAIANIRYHDEPLSFDEYGEYADSCTDTSPVRELLATLAWLGPHARAVLPDVESLRSRHGGLSRQLLADIDQAVEAIRDDDRIDEHGADGCCTLPPALGNMFSWLPGSRAGSGSIERTVFEDQHGDTFSFGDFFHGQPSIVVFFYTRCDNPLKCSLTITKLARLQELLATQGCAERIRTAAITYDPEFDYPERLRRYGEARNVFMQPGHRLLRATKGFNSLRRHFRLGVNFIESLVNRHRVEVYILDARGRIAGSFERIHWDEQQVVDRAVEVLNEQEEAPAASRNSANRPARGAVASTAAGVVAALGVAFFPKCPFCWAAYASMFGIAGLERIPYSPWLYTVLIVVMLINLASVWLRSYTTGRRAGLYVAGAGAALIAGSRVGEDLGLVAIVGVVLMMLGSLLSAMDIPLAKWFSRSGTAPARG